MSIRGAEPPESANKNPQVGDPQLPTAATDPFSRLFPEPPEAMRSSIWLLKNHAAHCAEEAIRDGDAAAQREKFTELVDLVGKYRS